MSNEHNHLNQEVLDQFSSIDGELYYNGQVIKGAGDLKAYAHKAMSDVKVGRIKTVKNKVGDIILPLTSTQAVYSNNGRTVEEELTRLDKRLSGNIGISDGRIGWIIHNSDGTFSHWSIIGVYEDGSIITGKVDSTDDYVQLADEIPLIDENGSNIGGSAKIIGVADDGALVTLKMGDDATNIVEHATKKYVDGKIKDVNYIFNNIGELAKSKDLARNDQVETLGYYNQGDGGGAKFIIESTQYDWSVKLQNGLYANINEPKSVNYRQFGAFLDGKQDDYPAMKLCHAYADSIAHPDSDDKNIHYTCSVENHSGVIYKQGTEPINCRTNVDLSGSTLILDDTNATWFGLYNWGDVGSLHWDYEITEVTKESLVADSYVLKFPTNDELPPNTVLKIDETPYAVRDDDGYLYSVGRKELIVHDMNGVCSTPLADDWDYAGGEEINCKVTDLVTDEQSNQKAYSVLKANYTYVPSRHATFTGCEVKLNMSADKYCSVLTAKRHNAVIQNFIFKPNKNTLHNKKYKNAMIYIQDSYNVTVRNIQGFNASGMQVGDEKATSGYMLRLTNCLDVHIEDCRLQGYWGATATDSVKNIYFSRCHMNRLDVHDYFYNLYATNCTFYHHSIQIGYGRGTASFTNCDFYYNDVPGNSYKEAYAIALNLTYGRLFEGLLILDGCNIRVKDAPNNEYSLVEMYFRPEATSIVKHFIFPEIRFSNINVVSADKDTKLSYVKIGGSRNARTSIEMPTHVYGETMDNTVKWKYVARGYDWGKETGRPLSVVVGDILRVADTLLNEEGKTTFYNYRYYKCTTSGTMVYDNKPNNIDQVVVVGTATFTRLDDPMWKSRHRYYLDDVVIVCPSNFYEPYVYKCIGSGVSDGYFPIHTSGTVLEGTNDPINEPDLCWWTYIGNRDSMFRGYAQGFVYDVGERLIAEERLYEVVKKVTATQYPPFDTGWLKTSEYGGGELRYIGNKWKPKKWFAKDSFCEADGRIYQLAKHDGITTGILPTKGNPYCVDGDLTWRYKEPQNLDTYVAKQDNAIWKPNTHYESMTLVKAENRIYEVQDTLTGSSYPNATTVGQIYMDGNTPVRYYGVHPLAWRVAGDSYEVGDLISDNTFIVMCIQAGTTNINSKWGCLESASGWRDDDTYVDGTCIWKKLTKTSADGVWRNSNRYYPSGKILIVSSSGNMTVFEVIDTKTGLTQPTSTEENVRFLDGTTTLIYRGKDNSWLPDSRYVIGDIVQAGSNTYECAFDGRMTLPNKSIFDSITTNTNGVSIFKFGANTNVPVKEGLSKWRVVARCCDNIAKEVDGIPDGKYYFGSSENINPIVSIQN